ncbi:uncharacterized protein PGTG_02198 [Puccinia graminis f. sp. tritici CRL 75-36-700-3]|uniref:Uncharacterized protein n=1 Tax=Puccinia graminis f. sp. tritici (strain CRL 75-36-700-3 / race SCCL) TaxID=418459 RepID=E3JXG2_PUCGT|nr:uncharacterized protein PGTG_02198 [Puccinia graminis f. sp. tritici CRL 75-36-700-3]EFP76737.1 hypothetical protein PGTG_02198 [Puccinia graminis f. sp. tritici CRL 75-36-700-3]
MTKSSNNRKQSPEPAAVLPPAIAAALAALKAEDNARELRAAEHQKETSTQIASMKEELSSLKEQVRSMKEELASEKSTVKRIDSIITQAGRVYTFLGQLYSSRADTQDSPTPAPEVQPKRRKT